MFMFQLTRYYLDLAIFYRSHALESAPLLSILDPAHEASTSVSKTLLIHENGDDDKGLACGKFPSFALSHRASLQACKEAIQKVMQPRRIMFSGSEETFMA